MLKIYGHAASINVRKVLWACAELDVRFEREDWGGPFRSTATPEFRALNPVGLVPVIEDGAYVIWESHAIIRYLAAKNGRTDLLPNDPAHRARVDMWMDWQVSDFNNSWRVCYQGIVKRNPEFQDKVAIERSLSAFNAHVAIIDTELARTGGYICGPDFTLADIPIGLSLHRWRALPAATPSLSHVDAYYARLCDRPGFQTYGRDGGP